MDGDDTELAVSGYGYNPAQTLQLFRKAMSFRSKAK